MISFYVIRGNNSKAISGYLEGEAGETGTGEYYDKESGKVFEVMSENIKKIIEQNNLTTTKEKIDYFSSQIRAGLDMTYSFNKDISILATMFDKNVKNIIQDEMKKMIENINENYIETRNYDDNKNRTREKASALIQVFEHNTSRDLDIQLHYHCFISNKVVRESDKKLTSLEADKLIRNSNKIRIETNYQIVFRLQNELYDAFLDRKGDLRVLDDNRLIEKFSKRREEIRQLAKQRYNTDDLSKLSREQIKELVMITRKTKKHENLEDLKSDWLEELLELGYDEKKFLEKIKSNKVEKLDKTDIEKAFFLTLQQLDRMEGIFDKDKLYREYLIMLSNMSKETNKKLISLEIAKNHFEKLIRENLVFLNFEDEGGRVYLSTHDYLYNEKLAIRLTKQMMKEQLKFFEKQEIEKHIREFEKEKGFQLSSDQRDVLEKIVNSRLLFINGHAGAGKTTSLEVLKRVSDERKIKLFGLAPSGKAAEELSKTLGVGQTIDSFLIEISKMSEDEKRKNFDGSIIVVDEAGMVDVRKMRQLLEFFSRYNTKVILQGDYKQIKSVEAGDFYKDMYETIKSDKELQDSFVELVSIRRQKKQQYLEITKSLSDKDFHKAFEIMLSNKDQYFEEFNAEKIKQDFLKDYSETLIVCSTNDLKDELNKKIRDELVKRNLIKNSKEFIVSKQKEIKSIDDIKVNDTIVLGNYVYTVEKIDKKTNKIKVSYYDKRTNKKTIKQTELSFSDLINKNAIRKEKLQIGVGDRVMTTRNSKDIGVKNGEIWTVMDVKDNKIVLANDRKVVEIDTNKYNYLDHAYAITAHKSQGMTVKNVLIVDSNQSLNYNLFYVSMTRGKENFKIYTNNIVMTLFNSQKEQEKKSSTQFKSKKTNKIVSKSEIAEMLVLNNEKELEKYKKYIDNLHETVRKIQERNQSKERETQQNKTQQNKIKQDNTTKQVLDNIKQELNKIKEKEKTQEQQKKNSFRPKM